MIWSHSSLWTESLMEVWNSRAQRIRNGLWAPLISSALATPQDLAPPRPPYRIRYLCFSGWNRHCSFCGNCALAIWPWTSLIRLNERNLYAAYQWSAISTRNLCFGRFPILLGEPCCHWARPDWGVDLVRFPILNHVGLGYILPPKQLIFLGSVQGFSKFWEFVSPTIKCRRSDT